MLASPIIINKFWNQKLKIPSKFDFRLNIIDFYKSFFAMNLKYKNLFMVIFEDFYIAYLLKSFFNGYILK
jgi:hypothetical protein